MMNDIALKYNIVTQLQILSSYNDFFKEDRGIIYKMASMRRRKLAYKDAKLLDGEISNLLKRDLDNSEIEIIKEKLGVKNEYKKDFSNMSLTKIQQSINKKENEFDKIRYDLKIIDKKINLEDKEVIDSLAESLSILHSLNCFMGMYGDYNPLKVDVLLEIRDKLLYTLGKYVTYRKGVGYIDEVEFNRIATHYKECSAKELKRCLLIDFSLYLKNIKDSIMSSIYIEANR